MFINPGGPGESGTFFASMWGPSLGKIVGGEYDILGFDPRGTGASTPLAACFESEAEREIWGTQGEHRLVSTSDDTLMVYRTRERLVGKRCEERIGGEGGVGRFAGTASVARDLVEIAKKLGQEKVHYWGFVSHLCYLRSYTDL